MKKHILVISQVFFPEKFRINDLCEEWIKRGYKVTVLTGIPNYPAGKFFKGYGYFSKNRDNYKGINIIRIPIIPRLNNKFFLILNYFSFIISGFFWNIFTRLKAERVFIFGVSPITSALPGIFYSRRNKIPCYLYVQDLWPESVQIVGGINNKLIIDKLNKVINYIYYNCTNIFTTSKSFINAISARGVPLEKLVFWPQYAENFYVPLDNKKENEEKKFFEVIFTGNIGFAQGLEILPKTAVLLKQNYIEDIKFKIVGNGRFLPKLKELIELNEVEEYFILTGPQAPEFIPELISKADVAILTLTDNELFKMSIPAKLQSYLACGIPILGTVEGESAEIIIESGAGFISKPLNEKHLYQNIIRIKGLSSNQRDLIARNGRKYYETHFSKEKLINFMDKFLC